MKIKVDQFALLDMYEKGYSEGASAMAQDEALRRAVEWMSHQPNPVPSEELLRVADEIKAWLLNQLSVSPIRHK